MDSLQIQDGLQVADIKRLKNLMFAAGRFVSKTVIAGIVIGLLMTAVVVWFAFRG